MATKLQIKRTDTQSLPSGGIDAGELVYVYDTSNLDSSTGGRGDRLWIGHANGTNSTPVAVGGKYFTDMLGHAKGQVAANSAIITDAQKKINELFVENLKFYSNRIVSTATNGDIEIDPDGTGRSIVTNLHVNVGSTITEITEYIEDVTGAQFVTNGSHTGITVEYDDANDGAIDLSLEDLTAAGGGTLVAGSVGSSTAIPVLTVDAYGRITSYTTATISTSFNITDGTNSETINGGDTFTFSASNGVTTTVSATDTLTIEGVNATAHATPGSATIGVASFSANSFAVSSGHVTIKTDGIVTAQITDSSVTNAKLANDSIFLGTTELTLGNGSGNDTVIDGLTDVDIGNLNFATNIINTTSGSSLDLKTEAASDANINLNPDGDGVVTVPSGYTGRTGFNDNSLVPKIYVDNVATGLDVKESVVVATTAEYDTSSGSPTTTYSNGTNGVGATLVGPQEALVIDGYTLSVGERVLIKNQGDSSASNSYENGIYIVTNAGAAGSATWVLTRTPDANEDAELTGGSFFFVQRGTTYGDAGFVATHNGVPSIGTDPILFEQFSGAGQINPGTAMEKDGNTLNVLYDDVFINLDGNNALQIKDDSITNAKINSGAAIEQAKLSMLAADADSSSAPVSYVQSNLSLVTFDSNQFTLTHGWATVHKIDAGSY